MPRLLSVNAGMSRDIVWPGETVHTGIWKAPVSGPARLKLIIVGEDPLNVDKLYTKMLMQSAGVGAEEWGWTA